MEAVIRKRFQGIGNIVRFNRHFYLMALGAVVVVYFLRWLVPSLSSLLLIAGLVVALPTAISLAVSYYVYDVSNLYTLNWLDHLRIPAQASIININAGFDETSALLSLKHPGARLTILDFYDPLKHTEVSISRARKAYAPYPGTQSITTTKMPLPPSSADLICCILSAHEIRDNKERIGFFQQLATSLTADGRIVVAEHSRDVYNFLAYTIGFFHFYSKRVWKETFCRACLQIERQQKITPFITVYFLYKNGNAS